MTSWESIISFSDRMKKEIEVQHLVTNIHGDNADVKKISLASKFLSWKTLLSFIVSFTILYILISRVDLRSILIILKRTNWVYFLTAFVLFYLSIALRGIRWNVLLKNAGFQFGYFNASEILFLSWFANVIVPAKLGDIYRSYLMKRNYHAPMSTVLGSIFTERVFDMVFLFLLFGLSGLVTFQANIPGNLIELILIGFGMAMILIIVFLIMRHSVEFLEKLIPRKLFSLYTLFRQGALSSISNIPLISIYSVSIWLLEAGRLFFVVRAVSVDIDLCIVVCVALASSLLTTLPITPAGLGAVEFAIVAILSLFGITKDVGVSIAILDRLISYWSILPLGLLTFLISKKC